AEPLGAVRHEIVPTVAVICGQPGYCHGERLGRCAFAGGTRTALACARAGVPSPHSAIVPVPWLLPCDLPLYLLRCRACVSVSWALPQALASQAILPSAACGLVACSPYRPRVRADPMVIPFRLAVFRGRRSAHSAGCGGGEHRSRTKTPAPI